MTSVVEHQLQSNAILQNYKTVMESDFPGDARGVPVVGGAAVAGVMQRHQHNNPIPYLGNGQPTGTSILGGVMDTGDMFSQDEYNHQSNANKVYYAGETQRRSGLVERHPCNEQGHIATNPKLTIESGVFPLIFPHSIGFNVGVIALADYLAQRMQQLFSPFTLLKEYLLVMYQVRLNENNQCV